MTINDIHKIIKKRALPDQPSHIDLVETHTAWVLLTDQYAYKIKKPVKFSFLDFTTLQKRKFYCEGELNLNQRLCPDTYLKVLPIKKVNDQIFIDATDGDTIDYCLLMKRIDNEKEMNRLLSKGLVGKKQIKALAQQLAQFHQRAKIIDSPFRPDDLKNDFADILSVEAVINAQFGPTASHTLQTAVAFSNQFIDQHLPRFNWRQQEGYVRDVHGDLHSGNIFLTEPPIIFDCIEFSELWRQIDLLSEIGFLCMDMDFHDKPALSKYFLECYSDYLPCIFDEEDHQLFLFYKWYRAGVRLKVNCLGLNEHLSEDELDK